MEHSKKTTTFLVLLQPNEEKLVQSCREPAATAGFIQETYFCISDFLKRLTRHKDTANRLSQEPRKQW